MPVLNDRGSIADSAMMAETGLRLGEIRIHYKLKILILKEGRFVR